MNLLNPFIEIFRLELRQASRLKKVLWLILLLVTPTVIIIVINLIGERPTQVGVIGIGYFFFIQIFVPLISLMYGANIIAQEVDNKTLTYLLTRPVPKWLILIAKYLANVLAITLLLWVALAVCIGAGVLCNPSLNLGNLMSIFLMFALSILLGTIIFTAIFNLIGLITRKSLLIGLAYCLLIEWLLSNMPMVLQKLSVSYYLRNLLAANKLIEEFFITEISPVWIQEPVTVSTTILTLTIILIITLGVSIFIFRTREFILAEE